MCNFFSFLATPLTTSGDLVDWITHVLKTQSTEMYMLIPLYIGDLKMSTLANSEESALLAIKVKYNIRELKCIFI